MQVSGSDSEGEGADDEAMFRTDAALAAVLRASADAKSASKEVQLPFPPEGPHAPGALPGLLLFFG